MSKAVWPAALDPRDKKDYVADFSELLIPLNNAIASFTITLPADAVALGLEKSNEAKIPGATGVADTAIIVWFNVKTESQDDEAYNVRGETFEVLFELTTDNSPTPRIFAKRFLLNVADQ